MFVAEVLIQIKLPGCSSLKEKRHRVSKIRDKFGKQTQVAVCESGYQDDHKLSQWSMFVVAEDKVTVEKIAKNIESDIQMSVDGVIFRFEFNWI